MKHSRRNHLLITGIIATMLIHATWIWGLDSITLDILANNIGRCGLFIFVLETGRLIRVTSNKCLLLKKVSIIYILCFVILNTVLIFTVGNVKIDIPDILKKLILGIDGNIWIIHGMLVILILVISCRRLFDKSQVRKIKTWGGCTVYLQLLHLYMLMS